MAIGPVQLLVLGFVEPNFQGEIIDELQRLRESDTVRVIDALAVYKHEDGEIEILRMSNLTTDESVELGAKIGALIGLGTGDEEVAEDLALAGAEAGEEGIDVFSTGEMWEPLEEIPPNSAAALILLEHHWAVGLRDAIGRAGGFRIGEGFISPMDLVAIGLLAAEEAKMLEEQATASVPSS